VPPTTEREERFAAAERLLEQYFEQRAQAGAGALRFESFAQDHSELATELRELHAACGEVDDGLLRGQEAFASQQAQVRELLESMRSSNDFQHRYAIESELGKGGMGAVFRVVDRTMDRPLAMKVILGQVDAARSGKTPPIAPLQLKRFLNEAKITGQLDHPGIVPVHEVGVNSEGRAYFTMKLVKGRDLRSIFDLVFQGKEGWTETRALGVILKVCEAMAYAHSKGVIHRDLKPANVMVGNFGEVYVMDWGLARQVGQQDSFDDKPGDGSSSSQTDEDHAPLFTMEGDVIGTPSYMPPEQARGEVHRVGSRSDVYSIGAMLYELIAGYPPYCEPGRDTSSTAVLIGIVHGPPKALLNTEASQDLIAVCQRAMAREAAQRYPDLLALASDISAIIEGRPLRGVRCIECSRATLNETKFAVVLKERQLTQGMFGTSYKYTMELDHHVYLGLCNACLKHIAKETAWQKMASFCAYLAGAVFLRSLVLLLPGTVLLALAARWAYLARRPSPAMNTRLIKEKYEARVLDKLLRDRNLLLDRPGKLMLFTEKRWQAFLRKGQDRPVLRHRRPL
jgi:serine/threonine protein kinase